MESNVCINYEPENEDLDFADCETCKHFLVVHYATESKPAVGLCDLSPKNSHHSTERSDFSKPRLAVARKNKTAANPKGSIKTASRKAESGERERWK